MKRTDVPPAPGDVVHQLINTFVVPAPGRTPDKIKSSILDWMRRANSPTLFVPGDTRADDFAKVCRKVRRKALQNVKRLATSHPEIAAEIMASVQPGDVR